MKQKNYTVIVPCLINAGPVNVAMDIARCAVADGWVVTILYLSEQKISANIPVECVVRKFKFVDIFKAVGIIHTHCLRPDLLGFLFSFNRRCRVVTTLHNYFLIDLGFDHPRPYVLLAWLFWGYALKKFSAVFCISNAMLRYYLRKIPNLPYIVAYNFRILTPSIHDVDEKTIRWIHEQKLSQKKIIAYVGSVTPRKNLITLINKFSGNARYSLLICGGGNGLEAAKIHADFKNGNCIFFSGHLNSVAEILESIDLLVLPSFAEGMPLVVLEAACFGVPSLLSNIAVHRELAKSGLGYTFNHKTFEDFFHMADLATKISPVPSESIKNIWTNRFSPSTGYLKYQFEFKRLLAEINA